MISYRIEGGVEKLIVFTSRTLASTEKNYSTASRSLPTKAIRSRGVLQIATTLLKVLCKEVIIDTYTYKAYVENEKLPKVFVSFLGIGDSYN